MSRNWSSTASKLRGGSRISGREKAGKGIDFTLRERSGISHIFYVFLPHSSSVLFVCFLVLSVVSIKSKHLLGGSNKAQAASAIIPVVLQQNPIKFRKGMFKYPTRFMTETNLSRASMKTPTFLSRLQYLQPKSITKEWKGFLKYNCACREGCRKQIVANQGEESQNKHYKM